MRVFGLDGADVKGFMNRLLKDDIFDAFETRGIELLTLTRINISGETEEGETRAYRTWAALRPLAGTILRQGEKPRFMKIVFSADAGTCESLHENAAALFLNLLYENDAVTFTAATAQKRFSLDKSLDASWDEYIESFLKRLGVKILIL